MCYENLPQFIQLLINFQNFTSFSLRIVSDTFHFVKSGNLSSSFFQLVLIVYGNDKNYHLHQIKIQLECVLFIRPMRMNTIFEYAHK